MKWSKSEEKIEIGVALRRGPRMVCPSHYKCLAAPLRVGFLHSHAQTSYVAVQSFYLTLPSLVSDTEQSILSPTYVTIPTYYVSGTGCRHILAFAVVRPLSSIGVGVSSADNARHPPHTGAPPSSAV